MRHLARAVSSAIKRIADNTHAAEQTVKAHSRKEALARTVRLLTQQGTIVTFRGSTPFVAACPVTYKVKRLNLPEIPDDAPEELIEALQGYVDHECGHIFFTPFDQVTPASVDRVRSRMENIFDDVRLEKLLPRKLPGTKDNLERMYINWLPLIVQPMLDEVAKTGDRTRVISSLLMPMMRALGGQKVFMKLMDDKRYWAVVEPLMKRLPGFGALVSSMETYDDVKVCVEKLIDALTPPPPPPTPPSPPEPEPEPEADEDPQNPDEGAGEDEDEGSESGADDETDDGEEGSPGDNEEDDDAGNDSDATGDDQADAADEDDGAGDPPADDADGDGAGDEDDASEAEDGDEPGDEDQPADGGDGKRNRTMTEALGLLDPTLRRALFLHKKRKMSVSAIASEMNVSADRVEEMLREARRGLAKLMKE